MAALLSSEMLVGSSRPRPRRVGETRATMPLRLAQADGPRYEGFDPFACRAHQPLRLIGPPDRRHAARRRMVALCTAIGTVAALAALWFGAGALRSDGVTHLGALPGSVRAAHGYRYLVQPGDTVWSIATRLDPSGDPRPIMDQLDAELHGGTLMAGQVLLIP